MILAVLVEAVWESVKLLWEKGRFNTKPIWCNVCSAFVLPSDRYPAVGGCGHNGGHTVVGWDLYRSFDESWE